MYIKEQYIINGRSFDIEVTDNAGALNVDLLFPFRLLINKADVTAEYVNCTSVSGNLQNWNFISPDKSFIYIPSEKGVVIIDTDTLVKNKLPNYKIVTNFSIEGKMITVFSNSIHLFSTDSKNSTFIFLEDTLNIDEAKIIDGKSINLKCTSNMVLKKELNLDLYSLTVTRE